MFSVIVCCLESDLCCDCKTKNLTRIIQPKQINGHIKNLFTILRIIGCLILLVLFDVVWRAISDLFTKQDIGLEKNISKPHPLKHETINDS